MAFGSNFTRDTKLNPELDNAKKLSARLLFPRPNFFNFKRITDTPAGGDTVFIPLGLVLNGSYS